MQGPAHGVFAPVTVRIVAFLSVVVRTALMVALPTARPEARPVPETLGRARSPDLFQIVHQIRPELNPMAVGIDHRMFQAGPQGSRFGTLIPLLRGHRAFLHLAVI